MQNISRIVITGILTSLIMLTSCKREAEEPYYPIETAININMIYTVGSEALVFDTIRYTNAFGNKYSVIRLQYFISDIELSMTNGTSIFMDETFYVNARDIATTNVVPQTLIPIGNYDEISFVFGLTPENNLPGQFPDPPENNMEWPPALGTGYHYMKLEGKVDSAGQINNFQAHTGPTNGNQNFIRVTLSDFVLSIDEDHRGFRLQMDLNRWWEGPHTIDLNTMTMVMGNQAVQQQLQENGRNAFSYQPFFYIQPL